MTYEPFTVCEACGAAKLKLCSACGTRLPRSRFHLDATRADRLATRCDTCASLKNHRERVRAKRKRSTPTHNEPTKEYKCLHPQTSPSA